ncbi:MAG: GSCFA domain-containing protein [Methylovulum sp.]|nr:GSCFA domain-containing protein [Methylovulum sp.]
MAEKPAMPKHPYKEQPDKAFWKKVVSDTYPLDISEWYVKKFPISDRPIATAGSCFAQHIGKQLKDQGFNFMDVEPAPEFLDKASHLDFGYGMYSARYGNVYSSRQLVQLFQRAVGEFMPEEAFWHKDGGYVDPFRPTIEPVPFVSIEELTIHRDYHLQCVRTLFKDAQVFVFTLGLTETWVSKRDGSAYPVAPGVSGGVYDPDKYQLLNLSCEDVIRDMETFFKMVRQLNNKMRFILTVSPVPLMATATDAQVVVATMYSKSVLRAAAGFLADKYRFVDYFPSYEIISAPVMRGQFYNPDMRTVSHYGVEHVMKQFFKEHQPPKGGKLKKGNQAGQKDEVDDDVRCDEELLAVFGD